MKNEMKNAAECVCGIRKENTLKYIIDNRIKSQ